MRDPDDKISGNKTQRGRQKRHMGEKKPKYNPNKNRIETYVFVIIQFDSVLSLCVECLCLPPQHLSRKDHQLAFCFGIYNNVECGSSIANISRREGWTGIDYRQNSFGTFYLNF